MKIFDTLYKTFTLNGQKKGGLVAPLADNVGDIMKVGILVAFGLIVLASFLGNPVVTVLGVNSSVYQAINNTITAISTVPTYFGLFVLLVIFAIVYYVFGGGFGSKKGGA